MSISKKTKAVGAWVTILVVIVGGFAWYAISSKDSAVRDAISRGLELTGADVNADVTVEQFASCLAEKGATMYGAWWCPHCKEQKAMFGEAAAAKLAYVECTEDPNRCLAAKVEYYPTWIFSDGSLISGTQNFATLSNRTSCPVPTKVK